MPTDISTAPLHDLVNDLAVINRPADPATWGGIHTAQQQAHEELARWQKASDDIAASRESNMRPGTVVLGLAEARDAVALAELARDFAETTALRARVLLSHATTDGYRLDSRGVAIVDASRAVLTTLVDTATDRTSGYIAGPALRTSSVVLAPLLDRAAAIRPLEYDGQYDPDQAVSSWSARLDDVLLALGSRRHHTGDLPVKEVTAWMEANRNPPAILTSGLIAHQISRPIAAVWLALEQLAQDDAVAHGPVGWTLLTR
ncbi:hypothetical protein [Kitasatospora sp. NPDC059803]|uniref:hypothetical protein n=1 Tax=Kitasatospora sp. NPDC059803 TaxID=3346953 RepID=UPI00365537AD